MKQPDEQSIRPVLRVCLAKDDIFWGPGVRDLLRLIESTGSVRLACNEMKMSYSKGWKILGTLEREVGFTVVTRQQGGSGGGKAALTTEGKEMLARFQAFEAECRASAHEIFQKYFGQDK